VVKPELGTKRVCPNCGTKYYDLNHNPIVCPHCGTNFETGAVKARPQTAAAIDEDEDEVETEGDAEFVSLEEADDEAADSGAVKVDGDEDDEVEDSGDEDDTFLEDEDEEDDNVEDIIGGVDDEER
jgi:uncharacterized protein (TIGR02300 family)